MTDKEKEKIRAEIERLKEIAEYNLSHSKMDRGAWMQQASVCTKLLSFIDSMQKEPVSEDFEIALEKKVREAQNWTYIEEEGGECPLNEEFGADDLEEFAKWGADWVRNNKKESVSEDLK